MHLAGKIIPIVLCIIFLSTAIIGTDTNPPENNTSYFLACIEPPHNDRH